MRDFKGMKRQRGRNRGGGSLNGGGNGGGKPQQNVNRAFDSNGPDNVKIRGHAQHVFEKYQQLARDAFSSGDRVVAENYLQHADHYFRVLRTLQPQRPAAEILGRDVFASGLDLDFEDENEGFEDGADAGPESMQDANGADVSRQERFEPRQDGRRDDRYDSRRDGQARDSQGRDSQGRDNQGRDVPARESQSRESQDGRREERFEPRRDNQDGGRLESQRYEAREPRRDNQNNRSEPRRDDRADAPRAESSRVDAPRNDDSRREGGRRPDNRREREGRSEYGDRPRNDDRSFDNRNREDRPRDERLREDRPRDDRPQDDRRLERSESDLSEPAEVRTDPLVVIEPKTAPFPPVAEAGPSPMLRSEDGGVSEAPAFLQAASIASSEDAAEPRRPRPRRRRLKATDGEDGGGETATSAVGQDA